jgi:hypothetical protein
MSIAPLIQKLLQDNFHYDSLVTMKRTSSVKLRRKQAGTWLKGLRGQSGLTQMALADRLGFKYYAFISQVENGHGRVPTEKMEAGRKRWASIRRISPRN